MKSAQSLLVCLSITVATTLPAAAVPRVFVSGLGNDANPGSITSPKRSFASALTVTDAGGEIIVLDSAGYGPVTINKSVSIISPPGVYAGVTVTSGDGITVSIGPSDTVILRGLTLSGAGGGSNGINFTSGATLHVESCVVDRFQNGIRCVSAAQGFAVRLFVKDTITRDGGDGIIATSGELSLDQVRIEHNVNQGLEIDGSAKASIRNSVSSGNGNGMYAEGELSIESCLVAHNINGVASNASGVVRVSNSMVTDNSGFGFRAISPATMKSRGNNTVDGNATNVSGTITPLSGT
jgi:parallel beta helix pectate lyase-like protein